MSTVIRHKKLTEMFFETVIKYTILLDAENILLIVQICIILIYTGTSLLPTVYINNVTVKGARCRVFESSPIS